MRSLVPKEKNSAASAICPAVIAARGSSIIVPIIAGKSTPVCSATSAQHLARLSARMISSSCTDPTSGIMISGCGSLPSLISWAVASAIARTCRSNRPGTTSPRRTPRSPSIGFCSCSECTACMSRRSFSFFSPRASASATRTDSSVMSGRNSCSGGSSRRIVVGSPSIAVRICRKSHRCSGSSASSAWSRCSSSSARISRSTCWRRSPRNMCSVRHSPMPSRAEPPGPLGVLDGVGVRPHPQPPHLVGAAP